MAASPAEGIRKAISTLAIVQGAAALVFLMLGGFILLLPSWTGWAYSIVAGFVVFVLLAGPLVMLWLADAPGPARLTAIRSILYALVPAGLVLAGLFVTFFPGLLFVVIGVVVLFPLWVWCVVMAHRTETWFFFHDA